MKKMKKFSIIGLILLISITFGTMAMADDVPAGQNFEETGYYQHSKTGQIKYFKNGHPGDPSQWTLISEENPYSDCDNCKSKGNLQGTFDQSTGAWKLDARTSPGEEEGTITVEDGALASASENGGGAYFGEYEGDGWGVGGAGSLGASLAYAKNAEKYAIAGAVAGNISAAGVGGNLDKQCATIYGDGTHMTLAVKSGEMGMAYGTTSGQFSYSGQTGNGLVVGGGLTGGVSAAYNGANTSGAVAGGATVSGVGNVNIGSGGGGI